MGSYNMILTAQFFIFIRSIRAILLSIALVSSEDAPSVALALELVFGAVVTTGGFVRSVTTVIDAITDVGGQGAVVVPALEQSSLADPLRAR